MSLTNLYGAFTHLQVTLMNQLDSPPNCFFSELEHNGFVHFGFFVTSDHVYIRCGSSLNFDVYFFDFQCSQILGLFPLYFS